ncbi:MAG: hypothetical protein ACREQ5_16105, partial [Candidatus Dormibacteria bacterium]
LGRWGVSVGLEPRAEVLLHPATVERYLACGLGRSSSPARRTVRTNLRFVARRVVPGLWPPDPDPCRRDPPRAPYSLAEIEGFLALARTQPTMARARALTGLVCLGAGAGLDGADLRHLRGADVVSRSGGMVVVVRGRRARVAPVLSRYQGPLAEVGEVAGESLLIGGVSPERRNVTSGLVGRVSGGTHLPVLSVGRLRATWLVEVTGLIGLPGLLSAAGITCSGRLGEIARWCPPVGEEAMVRVLGGAT